jgi:hypothetical protein
MPHSTSPPRDHSTSPDELCCSVELSWSIPPICLQAILNCAACTPTSFIHSKCIYHNTQANIYSPIGLARSADLHVSHVENGIRSSKYILQHISADYTTDSSMKVELDDSIDLGQTPQCADNPGALRNTSGQAFDLLGIGALFG